MYTRTYVVDQFNEMVRGVKVKVEYMESRSMSGTKLLGVVKKLLTK